MRSDISAPDIFKGLKDVRSIRGALNIRFVISAERSFSSLKRLKTFLRSTMGQSLLSSLGVLHIECEIVIIVTTTNMKKILMCIVWSKKREVKVISSEFVYV